VSCVKSGTERSRSAAGSVDRKPPYSVGFPPLVFELGPMMPKNRRPSTILQKRRNGVNEG